MAKCVYVYILLKEYLDHFMNRDYIPETEPVGKVQPREGAGGLPHRKIIIRKQNGDK